MKSSPSLALRSIALVLGFLTGSASAATAQSVLKQETLGTGVVKIAESLLDLEVRNTYEVDAADLDADGDLDLVYGQFVLFNPDFLRSKNLPVPAWLTHKSTIKPPFV